MDFEIEFGDVEQSEPATKLRPDENKHYAVAAVGDLQEGELPVFVDLDAMRDMEAHALSDTSVELGGVMLGGQHRDEAGRPFVLVTDSLRAEHYEATQGSFKFTHETWEQITRERDEFPAELQMVGWYHTHPGWSVFLSGMDMFICDHFFNKPLDVALVIDPCRGDRGFFQWTGDASQRIRRTGGFYLVSSRFRQYELEGFATYLEGAYAMSGDPRGVPGAFPPPVIINGSQGNWQTVAVLGMLTLQLCFMMVLAWQLWGGRSSPGESDRPEQSALVQSSLERWLDAQQRETEADAKIEVLDRVVSQWDEAPDSLVASLAEQTGQVQQLQDNVRAHRALEEGLDRRIRSIEAQLSKAEYGKQRLADQVESLQATVDAQKKTNQKRLDELAKAKKELAAYEQNPPGAWGLPFWTWVGAAAGLGALLGGGAAVTYLYQQKETNLLQEDSQESGRDTNSEMTPSHTGDPPLE